MTSGILLGHLGFSLLLFLLLPTRNIALQGRLILLILAGATGFIVIDGLSLGDYMRSYTDDLAISTLLLLSWCVVARLRGTNSLSMANKNQLVCCFAVMALVLYPATLGLSSIDPYRLGFSPAPLLVSMFAVCLWLWWRNNPVAVGLISIATAAYLLDVKDSDNYWDYLIDPLLGLYCLTYLATKLCRSAYTQFAPQRWQNIERSAV